MAKGNLSLNLVLNNKQNGYIAMKKKGLTNHETLNQKWDQMVNKDPETYHRDWLQKGFQNIGLKRFIERELNDINIPGTLNNQSLQDFIDIRAKESEEKGEEFDPVKAAKKFRKNLTIQATERFHSDIHEIPEVGNISEADEIKWYFCISKDHNDRQNLPDWKKVVE